MNYYLKYAYRGTMRALEWTRVAVYTVVSKIVELVIISTLSAYYITEALILTLTPSFMRSEKSLRGKVVLVTGGAGGVGQELVLRLARQKAKVAVWDNNEKALENLQENLAKEGHKVYVYAVDVTKRENVYKYADTVKADLGPVDILINNAGIVCGHTLLEIPDHMIEKTYQVNILSHYWTAKAFLPDMIRNKTGHIVTVGSLTGLMGTYKVTDYSATKFATVGFHESLLVELKAHGHNNIHMTLVCPYFINTGMFNGCKPKNFPMLEPKDVAKRIITAIKREEVFVTMPSFFRYVYSIKNYIPAKLNWAVMDRVIQGPQTMVGMRSFHEIEAA